jgi:SAM-dependent methyltransferase
MLLYLRDVVRLGDCDATLHIAPEASIASWLRSETAEYVSVDLDSPIADVHADITCLPFDDSSFDVIVCAHVLEHVTDDRLAIAELVRVLRSDGTMFVQVPMRPIATTLEDEAVTSPRDRQRVFGQWDHVRICGQDYGERLAQAGLEVRLVDPVALLDETSRRRFVLTTGEPIQVCTKASAVAASS